MENWTAQEWLFIIGVVVILIAAYIKRDKLKRLGGGGKGGAGSDLKRK